MEPTATKRHATMTAKTVTALKPNGKRRDVFDCGTGSIRGLTLRITANGHKSWTLVYRVHGRKARWTIGPAEHIGLAAARKKASDALRDLHEKGIDPATAKSIERGAWTFADLAKEFEAVKQTKRSWSEDARILKKILLPSWKRQKIADINRTDVKAVIAKIVKKGHPVMANRVQALISTMFNFAIKEEQLLANPANRLDKQPEKSRDRVLSNDEIRELWTACEDATRIRRDDEEPPAINPMIARTLQMILATGQRPGEVATMQWADVNTDSRWWIIPSTVAKNAEAHRVPLTTRAIALLDEARDHGPGNKWVFGGIKGASVANRAVKGVRALRNAGAIDIDDIRRHDLRRTVASGMAEAGVSPSTISRVLNHVDKGARATQVYNRYSYDKEKRDALSKWDRRLNAILAAKESKVVAFSR